HTSCFSVLCCHGSRSDYYFRQELAIAALATTPDCASSNRAVVFYICFHNLSRLSDILQPSGRRLVKRLEITVRLKCGNRTGGFNARKISEAAWREPCGGCICRIGIHLILWDRTLRSAVRGR